MAHDSKIEWTGDTLPTQAGCRNASPGCINCYARILSERLAAMSAAKRARGEDPGRLFKYEGTVKNGKWTGVVNLDHAALDEPLKRRKPTIYFADSMSDCFLPAVPRDFNEAKFRMFAQTPRHTYQVLTKHPKEMAKFIASTKHANLPNVWLGVTVEDVRRKSRINVLSEIPAAVRFLSIEPLLEDLGELDLRGIDWLIIGGESGPKARPFDPKWARSILKQARAARVPVFVKQMGSNPVGLSLEDSKGGDIEEWPNSLQVRRMPAPPEATNES